MSDGYEEYGRPEPAVRLGISSAILREFEIEEAIGVAGELGYEGMVICDCPRHLGALTDAEAAERAAQQFMNYGMLCVALRTSVGQFATKGDPQCEVELDRFSAYLDIARDLGCYMIQVVAGGPSRREAVREDHWLRAAHYLREACDLALGRETDVVVANDFGLTATVDDTLYLVDLVNRPNFGIVYSPGSLARTDRYYGVEALARFGGVVFNVEAGEAAGDGEGLGAPLLGESEINYQALFRWLIRVGYAGFVCTDCRREPDDEVSAIDIARHELSAMRQLLDEAI